MRVLFACERSAGHIFPALSIANKLKADTQSGRREIYFFLSSRFLKPYVQSQGYPTFGRYFPFRCLAVEGIWRLFEAIYIILKVRPQRVIGFGGRDSFFLILLSALVSIETIVYEPNLSFGRANKVLAKFAKRVLRGFPRPEQSKKSIVVGVPLRQNLKKIDKKDARRILNFDHRPVIFCCGGSQGSNFINETFLKFIKDFKGQCQVIHLTGPDKFLEISQNYNKIGHKSFVRDFYYQVEILYAAADIVVSRAGASSLAEISYYGLAALLLPHPGGFGHQKENALYFEQRGAAYLCPEDNFSFSDFSQYLKRLIDDEGLCRALGRQASKIKLGVGFENLDIKPYCCQ